MATESLRIEVAMLLSHYSNSLFIAVPLSMANNNLPRRIIKETQRLLSEPGLLLGSLPLSPYSDPFIFRQHCSCSANPILFKQPRFRSDLSYPLRSLRLEYSSMASASNSDAKSVYDFVVKDARGNDVDLSQYKGKVLLIVNVASQCGLTNSNYTELSELYTKYKDQGLEILAFPCNQFGTQEPGSNDQIVEFACTRFKAEFPIFDKVDVNGDKAAPIYKFLKSSKGSLFGDGIKWNFTKFMVDKNGSVVERYAPTTSPSSIEAVSSSWNYFYLKGAVPDQDLPS